MIMPLVRSVENTYDDIRSRNIEFTLSRIQQLYIVDDVLVGPQMKIMAVRLRAFSRCDTHSGTYEQRYLYISLIIFTYSIHSCEYVNILRNDRIR